MYSLWPCNFLNNQSSTREIYTNILVLKFTVPLYIYHIYFIYLQNRQRTYFLSTNSLSVKKVSRLFALQTSLIFTFSIDKYLPNIFLWVYIITYFLNCGSYYFVICIPYKLYKNLLKYGLTFCNYVFSFILLFAYLTNCIKSC